MAADEPVINSSYVCKWASNAPADLVQEYRTLYNAEVTPLKTLLKTYTQKEPAVLLRTGDYKGHTVQVAMTRSTRSVQTFLFA